MNPQPDSIIADSSAIPPVPGKSTHQYMTAAGRLPIAERAVALRNEGKSWREIGPIVGQPWQTVRRITEAYIRQGMDGLLGNRDRSGRPTDLELTEQEQQALRALYLRTNLTAQKGSMRTAAKFFALDMGTREEVRHKILAALEKRRLPNAIVSCLRKVTVSHVEQDRRAGLVRSTQFSGQVGAFVRDKIERRRVIESDDGTINFAACIPWPMGGDKCSDKYGVRVGRWQFLPAIECGWSHAIVAYSLVCRASGSYTNEDVRSVIKGVAEDRGLPDEYRFEHGAWKANAVTTLLRGLGVELTTVDHPTHKPFIEGLFNKLWTYLSVLPGQVGRFRNDEEESNRIMEACRSGSQDPRDTFPMLSDAIRGLDGAIGMHNTDTIHSIYGSWVPEVRDRELSQVKPWRAFTPELQFLFSPFVREWTVQKGTVGGQLALLDDFKIPYVFAHEELWRWNSRRVRVYFDPTAEKCTATIVALDGSNGFRPEQVICQAELLAGIPMHARASMGWADDGSDVKVPEWRKVAQAGLRRETRVLDMLGGGRVSKATTVARDGRGNELVIETGRKPSNTAPEHTPAPRRDCGITAEPPPRVTLPQTRQVELDPRYADFIEA